jgi:hypothetical protein
MKQKFFSVMAFTALLMSASCAKEDPAKPVDYSAPEKQATLQGKVLINENETLTPQKYSAKAGVTVIASVAYSQLNPGLGSGSFSATATTDSKGEFTLAVPATSSGVSVTLAVNDVQGSKTVTSPSGSAEVQQGKWSFAISSIYDLQSGQTKILPVIYGYFTQIKSAGDDVS